MKKFLLTLGLTFAAFAMQAQVVFYVEAPSPNEGDYDVEFAPAGGDWGVLDLTDPANLVIDTLVLVDDGTAADSLGCNALVNGADIEDQIAVVYRGECQFGTKAKMAQDAGAVAVVIINNVPGAPVGMAGGTDGPDVTIPVVMISQDAGALLRDEIDAQETTALIGSKAEYFDNDLSITAKDVFRPQNFGNIQALSVDDTEFEVELGAWVYNQGALAQNAVTLNATVNLGGTELYNETSTPLAAPLAPGDSVFITLPTFSQATYANGYYDIVYTAAATETEEFEGDNTVDADFMMSDNKYSMSHLDATTEEPVRTASFRATGSAENTNCIVFRDENASRMGVTGLTFSASSSQNPAPTSLDGKLIEIYAYKWEDAFVDATEPAVADFLDVSDVADGEYIYTEDLQDENIFVEFETPIALEDNVRYLFCVANYDEDIFIGFDTDLDYTANLDYYLQPLFPLQVDGTWNWVAFGEDVVPAISAHMIPAAELSLVELPLVDLEAYPNPAQTFINIPLNQTGNVDMTITDLSGKVVATQSSVVENNLLEVDVTSIAAGTYVIALQMENGERGTVSVVVNR